MPPRNEPPGAIEMKVNQTLRTLELMDVRIEVLDQRLTQRLDRVAEGLEALTEQIGRLSETTQTTQNLLQMSADRRDTQIDRLLGILERMIPSGQNSN